MKFAVETIVYGADANLEYICSETRKAGYQGIELFQDPAKIGGPAQAYQMLRNNGLSLVGVAGGILQERIDFVREYAALLGNSPSHEHSPYVYIDEWKSPVCNIALQSGIRLAIHPHMFRPIQTIKEALLHLNTHGENKNVFLMPDAAHLTIAGDDVVDVVRSHISKIHAIHLKDWRPNVGRSYQFYASGFCRLGNGSVKLKECLIELVIRRFNGWIVVEQDFSQAPVEEITQAMQWLKSHLPMGFVKR